jgi:signal transduction histidine kinase
LPSRSCSPSTSDRDRIFDRFYRVDKGRSRELGGAGLGLSLVKWAAEVHGGVVELDTIEGAGSTFRLVIPLATPADGAAS